MDLTDGKGLAYDTGRLAVSAAAPLFAVSCSREQTEEAMTLQRETQLNQFLADILKLHDNDKLRARSKCNSNATSTGKNSTAPSRGNSKPRTRQGTPVNMPTTPSATS